MSEALCSNQVPLHHASRSVGQELETCHKHGPGARRNMQGKKCAGSEDRDDKLDLYHITDADESSDDDVCIAADPSKRAMVAMWTWATPRSYLKDQAMRRRKKQLIPTDVTKREVLSIFLRIMQKCGEFDCLLAVCLANEPHAREKPDGGKEMHYHVAFKSTRCFAHKKISKALGKEGMHGWMSVGTRRGWLDYVEYLLCETPKKLAIYRDAQPTFWPCDSDEVREAMKKKMQDAKEQVEKKKHEKEMLVARACGRQIPARKEPRKRTLLTPAEFADYVTKREIHTERDLWKLAAEVKEMGEPALYNYCFAQTRGVHGSLQKVWKAFAPDAAVFGDVSLVTEVEYPLSCFRVPHEIRQWMETETLLRSLIIQGPGGVGKTAIARAVLKQLCGKFHFIDLLGRVKHLSWLPGDGILFDDISLATLPIDNVKGILDVELGRDVHCRHENGMIPRSTLRIFATNHSRETFFPRGWDDPAHVEAITRRFRWVLVEAGTLIRRPELLDNDEEDEETDESLQARMLQSTLNQADSESLDNGKVLVDMADDFGGLPMDEEAATETSIPLPLANTTRSSSDSTVRAKRARSESPMTDVAAKRASC